MSCLGREELGIHRIRDGGPVYHLNQFFVNKLVYGKKIFLRGEYQKQICGRRKSSPSIALLKHLLLVGDRIFVNPAWVESLLKESPKAFFVFLLKIQEMAPDHQCLEQHLPHYAHFIQRHKHLEEEGMDFLKEKNKLREIFKVLERPRLLLSKCHRPKLKGKGPGKP